MIRNVGDHLSTHRRDPDPLQGGQCTPIQPTGAVGVRGSVHVEPEYGEGLKNIEGFSHLILLYHFHLIEGYSLQVQPYLDKERRGMFATRIPGRPNPIGLSIVRLVGVDGCTLHVEDVDIIDGTPLLDIKPYVPDFDMRETYHIAWLAGRSRNVRHAKSDGRTR